MFFSCPFGFVLRHYAREGMGNIQLFEISDLLTGELQIDRFDGAIDVTGFCRSDDRGGHFCQQPGKGHFGHAHTIVLGHLFHTGDDQVVMLFSGFVLELRVSVFGGPFCALFPRFFQLSRFTRL